MASGMHLIDTAATTEPPALPGGSQKTSIHGYTLLERLGAGGYGEVWKAEAPGGLLKAVKIVYGAITERRAAQELKALERLRGLNHPFLLSIERVDVHDDRLVIVTELATCSLRERWEACRAQGKSGIPRDELIDYLREAAEALDYLGQVHGLQHLDVKPENLLMVAGHIKVGDFGLVKQLAEQQQVSLICGMTPAYAAPEVLDGRPSRQSDQYSLAIVYHEMATGGLPFTGSTAAQLASQHLHAQPNLERLTPCERFAVGRALAKEPAGRFATCREFVERLIPPAGTVLLTGADPEVTSATSTPGVSGQYHWAHDGQTMVVTGPESQPLAAIAPANVSQALRPTVLIGIGYAAGGVLRAFRQLLTDRFAGASELPAVQCLYLDTDVDALENASHPEQGKGLAASEKQLLPLHSTWVYRDREVSQLASISRRWVYNIPRNQRTSGIRALGRIALLDHADRVKAALKKAITGACTPEALDATSRATESTFAATDPRVVVIASISGGTGSGMVVDVGYAVRQCLLEAGYKDDNVLALLLCHHPNNRAPQSLEIPNAVACIKELQHFCTAAHDYPGEPTCGLVGFREERPTFSHAYIVDWDDRQGAAGVGSSELARYLLLSTVTPASGVLDLARAEVMAEGSAPRRLTFRTLFLGQLSRLPECTSEPIVSSICLAALMGWRGPGLGNHRGTRSFTGLYGRLVEALLQAPDDGEDRSQRARRHWESRASEMQLDQLRAELEQHLAVRLGCEGNDAIVEEILRQQHHRTAAGTPAGRLSLVEQWHSLCSFLGFESSRTGSATPADVTVRDIVRELAEQAGARWGDELGAWLLECVESSRMRVTGASDVAALAITHLRGLITEILQRVAELREKRSSVFASLQGPPGNKRQGATPPGPNPEAAWRQLVELAVAECIEEGTLHVLRVVESRLVAAEDQLQVLWKELSRLCDEIAAEMGKATAALPTEANDRELVELLLALPRADLASLYDGVNAYIQNELTASRGTLMDAVFRGQHCHDLLVTMHRAARLHLSNVRRVVAAAEFQAIREDPSSKRLENHLRAELDSMNARRESYGGAYRLMFVCPDPAAAADLGRRIESTAGQPVTVIQDPKSDPLLMFEVGEVDAQVVLNRLLRSQPEAERTAARLHTRVDVSWLG